MQKTQRIPKARKMLTKEIAIIGGGVIGTTTAFYLSKQGHNVEIIDPELNQPLLTNNALTGSKASLGVIMGNTFRRASGRSWRLRQRSMQLWPNLIANINNSNNDLQLERPLIQLASRIQEMELFKRLSNERKTLGINYFEDNNHKNLGRTWPNNKFGGLISNRDGRINPKILMQCLIDAVTIEKVNRINSKAISLKRLSTTKGQKWKILLDSNNFLIKDYVIICAALGSELLLNSIGYDIPIESVLGQAVELNLIKDSQNWKDWPSVLIAEGINLIPQKNHKIILGATLELGEKPSQAKMKKMLELNGNAPEWLKKASITNYWYGLRARPKNQPAPILANLEPGLIVNTAHYRNGILLAPACAEWVTKQF